MRVQFTAQNMTAMCACCANGELPGVSVCLVVNFIVITTIALDTMASSGSYCIAHAWKQVQPFLRLKVADEQKHCKSVHIFYIVKTPF